MATQAPIHPSNTIVACCTPQGPGALALLRISGPQAFPIGQAMAQSTGLPFAQRPSHTIVVGKVLDCDGIPIDQVLWLLMQGPKTFTGYDTIEITCHNNPLIIQQIIETALRHGAHPAGPGEFTQQAVLNGKMDLLQAEAIHELIQAQSQQAIKRHLAQLQGTLSQWLQELENDLLMALAWCNTSFEFVEEEGAEFGIQLRTRLLQVQEKIHTLLAQQPTQKHLQEGFRIALLGTVNAGKSSLFNALLQQPRAIVTHIAGTTRDSIEAQLYTAHYRMTLIDTAGVRSTDDVIEQQGIDRSLQEAERADVVLLILDSSTVIAPLVQEMYRNLQTKFGHKALVICNKIDAAISQGLEVSWLTNEEPLVVSCKDQTGILQLKERIGTRLEQLAKSLDAPYLMNARQYQAVQALEQDLQQVLIMTAVGFDYELLAFHLQEMIARITELTGKTVAEQAMNKIFQEFCVGK